MIFNDLYCMYIYTTSKKKSEYYNIYNLVFYFSKNRQVDVGINSPVYNFI